MNQRILAVTSTLAAAGIIVACALLWQILDETRSTSQQIAGLSPSQPIEESSRSAGGNSGSNWQPLSVTLKTENEEPVPGSVWVHGKTMEGGSLSERVDTDAKGVADFGLLPPGEFEINYYLDEMKLSAETSILHGPGRDGHIQVVCPSGSVGEFELDFAIQPPDDLQDIPLYYLAKLDYESLEFNDENWDVSASVKAPVLLLSSQGQIMGQTTYEDVTYRERMSGNSYAVNYLEKLPPDFELKPIDTLPAYQFEVEFWPYLADPEQASANAAGEVPRPPLQRLRGAALQRFPEQTPKVGKTHTVALNDETAQISEDDFWTDIKDDLQDFDRYEDRFSVTDSETETVDEEVAN